MSKLKYNKFEEMIWEDFLQTGLDDSEWPDYIDDAIESHNSEIENNWRDYAY